MNANQIQKRKMRTCFARHGGSLSTPSRLGGVYYEFEIGQNWRIAFIKRNELSE